MQRTLVILVVGLAPNLVGPHTPNLSRLAKRGGLRPLTTVTPAVTCSVQSTLATGLTPAGHGAVANGWYFRDLRQILLWRQPNNLVAGEKIWDAGKARNPDFTCAKMFWWYNMYASADWTDTPRPMYPSDGRKIPDHYTQPMELRDELDAHFGQFPLFKFWGPVADITSSDWITKATLHILETRQPTLTLTYLPHLDYNLQRLGPDLEHPRLQQDLREIDACCGALIDHADQTGQRVLVVSEYGITKATGAVHINRVLRGAGLLAWRMELGREMIDVGASQAFAMADHQIAHVYVKDPQRVDEIQGLLQQTPGIEAVWGADERQANGLDHARSGELIAIAEADKWFSYYYWEDDAVAPDYARTVDIHQKPGYDPVELFFDPEKSAVKLQSAFKLAKRKLGFRGLLDVISCSRTDLVKGTHGRPTDLEEDGPLVISSEPDLMPEGSVLATDFKALTLKHIFGATNEAASTS
ncbi:MAG: nucleotide pyrophosphatase/phosphodiesterase family protein [Pseudomonadota bacterium]